MEFMNASGTTVYLKVSVEELAKRLELCKHTRPVLKGRSGEELRAFIAESLEKRNPFYTKASITFDAEKMLTESDLINLIIQTEMLSFILLLIVRSMPFPLKK